MNFKQKQLARQRVLDLMEQPKPIRGLFTSNTIEHETVKIQIAWILMKQGFEVFPECTFKNGGRADLVAINNGQAYIIEVLHTESEGRFLSKLGYYPDDLTIVSVKTKEFDYKTWSL